MERTLDRYRGPATFELTEGSFTAECDFAVYQTMVPAGNELLPGSKGWRGSFVTADIPAWTGDGSIRLEDGRTGKVVVTHVRLPTGYGTFTGNGEPPA